MEITPNTEAAAFRRNKRKWLPWLLGVLLLLVVAIVLLRLLDNQVQFDPEAKEGTYENGIGPGITERLQEAVDDSMFRIQLNTRPVFDPNTLNGDVMVINSADNKADMQVTITIDATGETVYKSTVIAPGLNEAYGTLATKLEQGVYPATAHICAINSGTGVTLGEMQSQITLTVGDPKKTTDVPDVPQDAIAGEPTPEPTPESTSQSKAPASGKEGDNV